MKRSHRRLSLPIKVLVYSLVFLSVWLVGRRVGYRVHRAWRHIQKNDDLIAAIKQHDAGTVERLLENGADPNTTDGDGTPALEVEFGPFPSCDDCLYGKPSEPILLALFKHGADPNVKDELGMTPFLVGCERDDNAFVQMALSHGAKVNLQDDRRGDTPLIAAASHCDIAMIDTLLAHGSDVNVKNKYGQTALMWALMNDRRSPAAVKVVKVLLDHGADMNVRGIYGSTPLSLALNANRPDLIRLLRQYGAKK